MARWRQTLFVKMSIKLGIVGVLFLVIQLIAVVWMYVNNPNDLDQLLVTAEANRVASDIPRTLGAHMVVPERLKQPLSPATRRAFVVHDRRGRVVARYNDGALRVANEAPASFLKISTQREAWGQRFLLTGTRRVDISGRPFWITVAISGRGFRPFIPIIYNEIRFHVLFPLALLSVLFLVFNFSVVSSTLRPLKAAIAAVERIDPSQISARIPESASSWELQALTAAVNRMLERIERSVRALREFSGNAAHELRTPLAVMMLSIGKLPDGEAKSKLLKDAQGMQRLVDQLLDMAQANALVIGKGARADLGRIAHDVVADLTPLAIARGKSITYAEAGAPVIRGHAEAIGRALRNVIENGLSHTPPGTAVEVTSGPGAVYTVRDHGPGIPQERRAEVLQRFYRLDKRGNDGVGLGLAIALTVVEAHGGHIQIADAPGGGALLRLTFGVELSVHESNAAGTDARALGGRRGW